MWHQEAVATAFTMLTVAPGSEIRPFHDRQIAVLRPAEWAEWLYLTKPEADLIRPLPHGSLKVGLARIGTEEPPAELKDLVAPHFERAPAA